MKFTHYYESNFLKI